MLQDPFVADQEDEYQHHIVYETSLLHTTPAQAFDAFARIIWWGGGGFGQPSQISVGDSRTLEGSVRAVPLGIHEAAQKVNYPTSFEYTLVQKSIFPVSAHRGEITFRATEGDASSTRIVWNIHYTPFKCMNWLARSMIAFLSFQLNTLKTTVEKENHSKPKGE